MSKSPFFGRRPLNSRERHRVKVLEKRARHLNDRIAAAAAVGRELSYDRQELAALEWALGIIGETPENASLVRAIAGIT